MYSYKIIVVLPFVEAKFQSDNVDADRAIFQLCIFTKNTKSTYDMLSLTVFAWEFRDNALWDTL